jgi:hypothetical protein
MDNYKQPETMSDNQATPETISSDNALPTPARKPTNRELWGEYMSVDYTTTKGKRGRLSIPRRAVAEIGGRIIVSPYDFDSQTPLIPSSLYIKLASALGNLSEARTWEFEPYKSPRDYSIVCKIGDDIITSDNQLTEWEATASAAKFANAHPLDFVGIGCRGEWMIMRGSEPIASSRRVADWGRLTLMASNGERLRGEAYLFCWDANCEIWRGYQYTRPEALRRSQPEDIVALPTSGVIMSGGKDGKDIVKPQWLRWEALTTRWATEDTPRASVKGWATTDNLT